MASVFCYFFLALKRILYFKAFLHLSLLQARVSQDSSPEHGNFIDFDVPVVEEGSTALHDIQVYIGLMI